MALFIAGAFYVTMVAAGYVIEMLFGLLHLVPHDRAAKVVEASIRWNYTTLLEHRLSRRGRRVDRPLRPHRWDPDAQDRWAADRTTWQTTAATRD